MNSKMIKKIGFILIALLLVIVIGVALLGISMDGKSGLLGAAYNNIVDIINNMLTNTFKLPSDVIPNWN